jgi:hypothetical protein
MKSRDNKEGDGNRKVMGIILPTYLHMKADCGDILTGEMGRVTAGAFIMIPFIIIMLGAVGD